MPWLDVILLITSLGLVGTILLQNRSAGLGGAFGGAGAAGMFVRRGSEKRLFQATVILGTIFIATAAAYLFLN